MAKKIRELKQMLQQAGFTLLPKRGKGSHSYWIHPRLSKPVVLSGKDSQDAKPYQEKDVKAALAKLKGEENNNEI
ncbi:MAG: type II toxin-antitoxin system HicA family toxin [Halothece sp.]|jgi:predicted RNA binding protein YcfA (HicA-like mRNA interferase family)